MTSSRQFFQITAACASTVLAGRTAEAGENSVHRTLRGPAHFLGAESSSLPLENERAAAKSLDRLASAAEELGDPETELRALFQAAVLYEFVGDRAQAADRLPRIRELLAAEGISDETRRDIASRISRRTSG